MTGLDNDLDVYARLQRWQMLQAPGCANAGSVAPDPALNAAAVAGRRIGPMLAAWLAVEEHCKQHFAVVAPVTKGNVEAKSKLSK
jgi:hypothetical protein